MKGKTYLLTFASIQSKPFFNYSPRAGEVQPIGVIVAFVDVVAAAVELTFTKDEPTVVSFSGFLSLRT